MNVLEMANLPLPANQAMTDHLRSEIAHLGRSERGHAALQNIRRFIRDGGIGLDARNKRAVSALLAAAFNQPWNLPAELTSDEPRRANES